MRVGNDPPLFAFFKKISFFVFPPNFFSISSIYIRRYGFITFMSTEKCAEAEVEVTGGQTVLNPWPMVGGTAMSTCSTAEFIEPIHAAVGTHLVI